MCKVYCCCNQKGGTNKTTVVANLGIGLARAGEKVLLMDCDPQGSLTASLGYQNPDEISTTIATIMTHIINEEDFDPHEGILHHEEGVDLLPANIELSGLEVLLGNTMSREMILKEYIDHLRSEYTYILIDCMPSLGITTINALVAADRILIPVQAAYLPVKGLQQLLKTITVVKKRDRRNPAHDGRFQNELCERHHTDAPGQLREDDRDHGYVYSILRPGTGGKRRRHQHLQI